MKKIALVTHYGTFHADEVTATALLKTFIPNYVEVLIRRVDYQSDVEAIQYHLGNEGYDVFIYDIGRIHSDVRRMFDHHQFTKEECPYSSAGLVFKWLRNENLIPEEIAVKLEPMISAIDDNDIGVKPSTEIEVSTLIRQLNTTEPHSPAQEEAFNYAVNFMERQIMSFVNSYSLKQETKEWLANLSESDLECPAVDGKYGLMSSKYRPGLANMLSESSGIVTILQRDIVIDFYIWYDEIKDTWNAQTVNVKDSYDKIGRRILVNEEDIKNDKDIIFVHKGEFFMVAKTEVALINYLQNNLK